MVEINELSELIKALMADHDSLVQQREIARQQEDAFRKQGEELDRKLHGLKQTLQGLSLYSTAKNEPLELTKTLPGIADFLKSMTIPSELTKPRIAAKTLTECCREILVNTGEWMSAMQVRQSLHAAGFDFSEYKSNPLSSIHTTLKRISEAEQAWTCTVGNDTLYRWRRDGEVASPPPPPSYGAPNSLAKSDRQRNA